MNGRTKATLATGLAAAVVLFAATRDWQTVMTHRIAPLPPMTQRRSGTDLAPWLPALGAVGLAGAGALLATHGRVRAVVGVLLVVAGAGIAVAAGVTLDDGVSAGWPLLCLAGAAVIVAGGVATVRWGRNWPGMSARYERSAPKREPDLWEALDRGEDPTRDQ